MAILTSPEPILVEIDVFKCCAAGGQYYGHQVHDPAVPGGGPWTVAIRKAGVELLFGLPTKEEALKIVGNMTRYPGENYEIDIDPTED
jgi:hypothetical protein